MDDGVMNATLQQHHGYLEKSIQEPQVMNHNMDTRSGNSGSIINEESEKVIGIHTRGGCNRPGGGDKN